MVDEILSNDKARAPERSAVYEYVRCGNLTRVESTGNAPGDSNRTQLGDHLRQVSTFLNKQVCIKERDRRSHPPTDLGSLTPDWTHMLCLDTNRDLWYQLYQEKVRSIQHNLKAPTQMTDVLILVAYLNLPDDDSHRRMTELMRVKVDDDSQAEGNLVAEFMST